MPQEQEDIVQRAFKTGDPIDAGELAAFLKRQNQNKQWAAETGDFDVIRQWRQQHPEFGSLKIKVPSDMASRFGGAPSAGGPPPPTPAAPSVKERIRTGIGQAGQQLGQAFAQPKETVPREFGLRDVPTAHAIQAMGGSTATAEYERMGQSAKAWLEKALGEPWETTRANLPNIARAAEFVYGAGKIAPGILDWAYSPAGLASMITMGGIPGVNSLSGFAQWYQKLRPWVKSIPEFYFRKSMAQPAMEIVSGQRPATAENIGEAAAGARFATSGMKVPRTGVGKRVTARARGLLFEAEPETQRPEIRPAEAVEVAEPSSITPGKEAPGPKTGPQQRLQRLEEAVERTKAADPSSLFRQGIPSVRVAAEEVYELPTQKPPVVTKGGVEAEVPPPPLPKAEPVQLNTPYRNLTLPDKRIPPNAIVVFRAETPKGTVADVLAEGGAKQTITLPFQLAGLGQRVKKAPQSALPRTTAVSPPPVRVEQPRLALPPAAQQMPAAPPPPEVREPPPQAPPSAPSEPSTPPSPLTPPSAPPAAPAPAPEPAAAKPVEPAKRGRPKKAAAASPAVATMTNILDQAKTLGKEGYSRFKVNILNEDKELLSDHTFSIAEATPQKLAEAVGKFGDRVASLQIIPQGIGGRAKGWTVPFSVGPGEPAVTPPAKAGRKAKGKPAEAPPVEPPEVRGAPAGGGETPPFSGAVGRSAPVKANLAALPPVPEGQVRIYRGESTPGTGKGVPEWVTQSEKFKATQLARGRWFTEDPQIAQWYVNDAGPGGRLMYLDVPREVVERSRVTNIPEARRFSADPDKELFLPPEYAGKGTPIGGHPIVPSEGERGSISLKTPKRRYELLEGGPEWGRGEAAWISPKGEVHNFSESQYTHGEFAKKRLKQAGDAVHEIPTRMIGQGWIRILGNSLHANPEAVRNPGFDAAVTRLAESARREGQSGFWVDIGRYGQQVPVSDVGRFLENPMRYLINNSIFRGQLIGEQIEPPATRGEESRELSTA